MFSLENIRVTGSHESQPYVKLQDILAQPDVLKEENVTISCISALVKKGNFVPVIRQKENIKTVVKEEELREHIDDIPNSIREESSTCSMNFSLPKEVPVVIKSEKEDDSYENQESLENGCSEDNNYLPSPNTHGSIKNEVNTNSLEEKLEYSSSLDLHLSSDTGNNSDETCSEIENAVDSSTTKHLKTTEHSSDSARPSHGVALVNGCSKDNNYLTSPTTHGSIKNEVNTNSLEEKIEYFSSLDLHLSSSSENNSDETCSEIENAVDTSTRKRHKRAEHSTDRARSIHGFPLTSSSSHSNLHRSRIDFASSPDMFEESPEVNSQSSFTKGGSASECSTSSDNRERLEVWDTQKLSDVSRRLRLRTKQAKRMIMEVVRKRQMEEETLDAFKKRLRKM